MRKIQCILILFLFALNISAELQVNADVSPHPPEIVVVPTLRNDHQFNLDYTVAHLMALIDTINPDAIVVDDCTEWLHRQCSWTAMFPEIYIALEYARERSLPLFGTYTTPLGTYEDFVKEVENEQKNYPNSSAIESVYRKALDEHAAYIARVYSFTAESRDLQVLINRVFPSERNEWSQQTQDLYINESKRIVTAIEQLIASNPSQRRWVVMLWWRHATPVQEELRARKVLRVVSVMDYLPLTAAAIEARMDYKHTAWILAGILDEWYGMWAPQAFPNERVRALLMRLERLSPQEPATFFLQARWLMQNRDYGKAEQVLNLLMENAGDAKFPFPINGKWIRPPWTSIRDKAKLNLAFIYDYKGARDKALKLYHDLLEKGDRLNDEARSYGYFYDDIQEVIKSYIKNPYTGMPDEAFRHFPILARMPTDISKDR